MIDGIETVDHGNWGTRSQHIDKIVPALAKAQSEIGPVVKDSQNPFFKSSYADLATVCEAIRQPCSDNGLCVLQEPSMEGDRAAVTTIILHSSGQYIRSWLELPLAKQDPQGLGSAITYGRRYALVAIFGIAPEDDDGNAASARQGEAAKKPAQRAPVTDTVPNTAKDLGEHKITTVCSKQGMTLKEIATSDAKWWTDTLLSPSRLAKLDRSDSVAMMRYHKILEAQPTVIEE